MGKKLTKEEFMKKVFAKNEHVRNGDIEIRGEYVDCKTPVECYCKTHNITWGFIPSVLYQGGGCHSCFIEEASARYMMSHEEFISKLYEKNEHFRNGDFDVTGVYNGANSPVECYCNIHSQTWSPTPTNLYKGYGCPICGKTKAGRDRRVSDEEFRQRVIKNNKYVRNGEIKITGMYDGVDSPIEYYCVKHDMTLTTTPYLLEQGHGCPYCAGVKILAGFNDLSTTDPQISALLTNPEDGKLVGRMSHKKKNFTCPFCGKRQDKLIFNVVRRGLQCNNCSDHISFPNRFSRALFSQLPVDNYIPEYSPDWLLPYAFDNYFEYNGRSFVVENDAGIGHGNKQWGPGNKKDVEGKKRDQYKDKLAMEHNTHVIRIDTQESTCEYIKQHILDSELAQIFDLSNIDWGKCDMDAQKNLVKEVCDLYMTKTKNIQEIADIVLIGTQCVRNYLKRGSSFGWCDYDPKIAHKMRKKNNQKRKIMVTRANNNETFVFDSIKDCERKLPNMFGIKISYSMLYRYCHDRAVHKGFIFSFIEDNTK